VERADAAIPEEQDAEAESPASLHYGQVLQGASALIAPATLLTGIAFYFGWTRVRAYDEYFGLDPGAVGYSTRDYAADEEENSTQGQLDFTQLPERSGLLAAAVDAADVRLRRRSFRGSSPQLAAESNPLRGWHQAARGSRGRPWPRRSAALR
jgi:hypothetical protein